MPTVVLAYDEFPDIDIEAGILAQLDAEIIHTKSLATEADIDIAISADALMVSIQDVPRAMIERMQKCRIVSRVGTGLDAIDIDAATEKGIWVTNVPDYSVEEVSTHAIALLLARARRIPELVQSTQRKSWDKLFIRPLYRIKDQTLGLLGFGRIGQATARKARGLGMRVIAFDPQFDATVGKALGVEQVDFDTILSESDYISLHTPLTDTTQHIINATTLAQMKPSAFLINVARGALIDDDALLHALDTGIIAGAALDVFAVEPPDPEHPLLTHPKTMITPHIAWYSEAANQDVRVRAADEVVRVLSGGKPRFPVNQI
jgi:D-3-phosphoglycerate dehydrogenase